MGTRTVSPLERSCLGVLKHGTTSLFASTMPGMFWRALPFPAVWHSWASRRQRCCESNALTHQPEHDVFTHINAGLSASTKREQPCDANTCSARGCCKLLQLPRSLAASSFVIDFGTPTSFNPADHLALGVCPRLLFLCSTWTPCLRKRGDSVCGRQVSCQGGNPL